MTHFINVYVSIRVLLVHITRVPKLTDTAASHEWAELQRDSHHIDVTIQYSRNWIGYASLGHSHPGI